VEEEASSMFERFTERARKGVVLVQDEARRFGYACIGTEHIPLGLVRESVAPQMLSNLGIEADETRKQMIRLVAEEPDQGGRRAARPRLQSFTGRMDFEVQARCVGRRQQSPQPILCGWITGTRHRTKRTPSRKLSITASTAGV
jgi:ATP-dependent Clp protease ATP-binding subunit ClpA